MYADELFEVGIQAAEAQGFAAEIAEFSPEEERFTNVFVGGHSNGGIISQTQFAERKAAGFLYLSALKLYQNSQFNDMA